MSALRSTRSGVSRMIGWQMARVAWRFAGIHYYRDDIENIGDGVRAGEAESPTQW